MITYLYVCPSLRLSEMLYKDLSIHYCTNCFNLLSALRLTNLLGQIRLKTFVVVSRHSESE